MRPSPSIALLAALLAVLGPGAIGTARADRARALGAPYAPGERELPRDAVAPDAVSPDALDRAEGALGGGDAVPEIQELRAQPSAELGPRVYGDGHGDELSWDDPELDLEPRGWVHAVLSFSGAWLGATEHFWEAGQGGAALALDVCLEQTVSVHLRFGVSAALRTETRERVMRDELRSAALMVRGTLLVGVHLARLIALRVGMELGEGRSFVFGLGNAGTLGFAFVGQAGLRLVGGGLELGVEVAADLREGSVLGVRGPTQSIQETAPRLSVFLALTP